MCRNLIEIESEKYRKWVGHATEKGRKFEATALKNEKGEPTATLFHHEFGRYVTVISRDITSIIQCLRWCKTECAACTPCWKAWFEKLEHCWNSKIANLKEKSVSQKLRSSSFSTERVRKIRHRVTRCLHTHTHTPLGFVLIFYFFTMGFITNYHFYTNTFGSIFFWN